MIETDSWTIRHRWLIILSTLLISGSAAVGLQYLSFTSDNRVFFGKDNPQLQALEHLENVYSRKYNVMFMLTPLDGDVFTRRTLKAVEELTRESWEIPYSSRVDSIANFQHTRGFNDELIVEDLISDADKLSAEELINIRKIALSEPLLVGKIISPTGHVTGVNINLILPGESNTEVDTVTTFSRKLMNRYRQQFPDIEFRLTGALTVDQAFNEVGEADTARLVPVMFLVLIVIVGLFLRSLYATVATLSVILLSMVTALGISGWLGVVLNPASANAPTIILTLAVADSVHILVTVFQNMRHGSDKYTAIVKSINLNRKPVFLTSITTMIGFLTMNFSDAPPFRDLGNIIASGIAAAYVYSMLFLPALIAVLPLRQTSDRQARLHSEFLSKLADFVIKNYKKLCYTTIAIVVTLTAGLLRINLDEDFIKYFDKEYEARQSSDYMEEHLTGADVIEFSLDSGESGGISKPEYLAKIDEFANWYRKQDKVVHVDVFSDIMKRLNKNMHSDQQAWYKIPEQRNLAAQYLLLYEMSLPMGTDLNNQINIDKSSTRVTVMVKDATTNEQRVLDELGQAWLRENAPPEMHTQGTGLSIIWAHLTERTIYTMLTAAVGALILISFILIFALRSMKYGLLSLVPNLIPAAVAFGLWGILVGRVGLGLSVVVSMTLGIVVDDTVHFITKYIHARQIQGFDVIAAIKQGFLTVGEAMWITTAALVCGFLILLFSDYNMNAEMGLMTAITILLALLIDFLFLPTLLIAWDHKVQHSQ